MLDLIKDNRWTGVGLQQGVVDAKNKEGLKKILKRWIEEKQVRSFLCFLCLADSKKFDTGRFLNLKSL